MKAKKRNLFVETSRASDVVMIYVKLIYLLTDVKFESLFDEGVGASPGPVVLFQNEDFLSRLGHEGGGGETTDPGPHHDRVQSIRDRLGLEVLTQNFISRLWVWVHGRRFGQFRCKGRFRFGFVK